MIRPTTAAALAILIGGAAAAQEPAPVRTNALLAEPVEGARMAPPARLFEIRGGHLWLDGRRLSDEATPAGLDLRGIDWSFELVGPVTPVLEVDGELFVLQRERLIPFESSEKAGAPVYFLAEAEPVDSVEPRVDEAYLNQLSEADRSLYEQLQTEMRLEAEIEHMAHRASGLAPGTERDQMEAELRARLAALFDLKQEIRRQELSRAESEIRALRAVLDERQTMRDEVISLRLGELLGTETLD